ncbi:MAG TPA: hypothetical protein VIH58_12100 [Chthoniobacterales bacterium]
MDKRLGADRAGFEPRRAYGFAQGAPEYKLRGFATIVDGGGTHGTAQIRRGITSTNGEPSARRDFCPTGAGLFTRYLLQIRTSRIA